MLPKPPNPPGHWAFTLIEIMVTFIIVTILIAIAMPQFLRAREVARARSCVKNLNVIYMAKEQYAMDHRLAAGGLLPPLASLCGGGTTNYIKNMPICQAGGTYSVGDLGTDPECSIGTSIGTTEAYAHLLP